MGVTTGNLELRLLGPHDMAKIEQPDGIPWPSDSFCVCAFDENGKMKGRVGMICLPHMEGFWVDHDQLATGLAEAMAAKLEEIVRERLNRTGMFTFIFERATGLAETLKKNGWRDMRMKVFHKEL